MRPHSQSWFGRLGLGVRRGLEALTLHLTQYAASPAPPAWSQCATRVGSADASLDAVRSVASTSWETAPPMSPHTAHRACVWPFASSFKCKFAKSPQQAARISLLLTHTSLHAAACGRGARLPARSALSNWRGHICMQQCAAVSIDALSSMELRQLSQPIIIQGAAENGAALERWQQEKIIELYGNDRNEGGECWAARHAGAAQGGCVLRPVALWVLWSGTYQGAAVRINTFPAHIMAR